MIYCLHALLWFFVEDELTVKELIIALVEELVGKVELVEVTKKN
jgi:hypothetical protein